MNYIDLCIEKDETVKVAMSQMDRTAKKVLLFWRKRLCLEL